LKDSNVSFKKIIIKEEGVGVHSLGCNTLGLGGVCWSAKIGIRMSDKWVNYLYGPAQIKQQVG